MRKSIKILLTLFLVASVVFAVGRVRQKAMAVNLTATMSTGNNTAGTNILVGYLSPNSLVSSVDVLVSTAFDCSTNNLLDLFTINGATTNQLISDFSLARLDAITVAMTNVGSIVDTSESVPVYATLTFSGASNVTAGSAYVVVNSVQF